MELPKAGAEWLYWSMLAHQTVDAPVFVTFTRIGHDPDETTIWHAAEWADDGPSNARVLRLFVAGPAVTPLPAGAVRLRLGEYTSWVKVEKGLELILRTNAATLTVK